MNITTRIKCLLMVVAILLAGSILKLNAQAARTSKIWKDINESQVIITGERYTIPTKFRTLQIDKSEMQIFLAQAPIEPAKTARLNSSGLEFHMPMPDGSFSRFRIFEYYVMHPDLAAKFPDIKTYTGQGIDDASAIIKISLSSIGFHAMVLSPNGSIFIDPHNKNTTVDYICYYRKDLQRTSSFECSQSDAIENAERILQNNQQLRTNGTQLRTYDLALACTGEYAAFFGGTVSGATAGMVATMNRVNGIYEAELSIRMQMVANNNLITYTNSSTDPYTNGNGSTMLGQNQTTCDGVIGSANYDIGHVVSTGGGGVAGLGVVCSGGNKARGVTGSSSPTGDPFDVDYVAHEMGHQFGGSHTFNSATGSCNGNRTSSAAFEPGSGITIQAYAGICGSDDLAPNSIAYFHGYSLDQMITFSTTGGGNSCPTTTANGNIAPVVTNMAANCSIPISTPFVLTGAATDGNGDPLTYSWEERDLGPAGAWNVQSTSAPQFRTFPPTSSPSRTFPKISDIINNTTTIGELLPNQARTLKFRLTARDYRAGGGGIMHPDTNVIVQVVNSGGAFAVTAPNTAVTWAGGSTQTVTWNVSGTTGNGINTVNVKISLSTDGGNTFPTTILASTANDGTESITVPNTATTTARIKVEAVGNIFFDMSNTNFTITSGSVLSVITTTSIAQTNYCAGASLNVSYTTNASANAGNIFTAQLSNSAGSFGSPTAIGTLTSTAAGTISCTIPAGTATGSGYRIRVVSSNPVVNGSDNGVNITISAQVAAAGAISGTTVTCQGAAPFYSIGAIASATTYNWTVPVGANIISGAGTATVQIAFGAGSSGTVSVYGSNTNCTGTSSSISVTVNPLPTVFSVTGGGAYCAGGTGVAVGISNSQSLVGYQLKRNGTNVGSVVNGTGTAISFGLQTVAGTYTVNAAFATGCNVDMTGSAVVTINSLPTVTANNVSGCSGTFIALSGTPAGGTWSVPNPYTGSSTTYTHTYTDGNGCTNTSAAASITVNPLPTVTANNVSGCTGAAIPLSGSPAGGTWSVGNPYPAGPSTTYTHTYTDVNGCTNTSAPANITVNPNPTPTISGSSSFCTGSSIVLDAGAGYTSYNWMPGGDTQTITVTIGSIYQVTVTDANGCSGTSAAKTVTENPLPTVTANNVSGCAGTSIVLSGTPAGGTWSVANPYTGSSTIYTHTYTDGNGCTNTSASASIIVNPNPTPFISGALSFCAGSSTTLNAGSGYSFYNWSTGATTQSISVSTANTFTATVTDGNGCTGSASATTTVISLPSATTSPSGTVTTCNSSQILTAGSGAGYSYQWRLNGSNIGGATSVSYNATSNGNYDVVVTQSGCSSTSPTVNLTLGTGAPVITASGSTTICEGTAVTLNAPAGATAYQWYKNGVAQAGATSASFATSSAGNYYCAVTAPSCSGNSNTLTIIVTNNPAPVITYSTPLSFCSPGSVLFTANTFAGVTYVWEKNSVVIPGATSQTYTATSNGKYRVKETANGCLKSSVEINVAVATSVSAVISANGPVTFCSGGSVVLSVNNSIPGYGYQWKNNGLDIGGATTSSYTATAAGSYTCAVSATCGNATSNAIVVSTSGIAAIVSPAGSISICSGATVSFSANTGAGYTFQWQNNGVDIAGATSSTYNATVAGNYSVFINSPCGNANSAATNVTIAPLTANITPSGTTSICNGSATTYSANTGYNYTYQWFRNGGAITGATNSTLATSNAGNYTVTITQGGSCTVTSGLVTLAVINNPNPTITPGGPTTFCAGGSVTLTANTFAGVAYQWQKGSTDIAGATAQNYVATTTGAYRVKETANGCSKIGTPIQVTVNCRLAGNGDGEQEMSEIKISPNPFSESATISISPDVDFKNATLEIYNILGMKVKSLPVEQSQITIAKEGMQPGVYMLRLSTGNSTKFTSRFVVK